MTDLYSWATKWGISPEALADLRMRMGLDPNPIAKPASGALSEAGVSSRVRLAAAQGGMVLWRNNVGAMQDATGRVVRYGLANESKAMNKEIKSSDLIGLRPVRILPQHVGQVIGQFVARETKKPGWTYSGTDHEIAQLRFMEIVIAHGGDACFTDGSVN